MPLGKNRGETLPGGPSPFKGFPALRALGVKLLPKGEHTIRKGAQTIIFSASDMDVRSMARGTMTLHGGLVATSESQRVTLSHMGVYLRFRDSGLSFRGIKAAKLSDLRACLASMKPRPIKLVVSNLWKDEFPWEPVEWRWKKEGNTIARLVLLDRGGQFGVSFADEWSRQEFHVHSSAYDTYVSSKPVELAWSSKQSDRPILFPSSAQAMPGGLFCVTIPPGVWHRATLKALTFVIQQSTERGGLMSDSRRALGRNENPRDSESL